MGTHEKGTSTDILPQSEPVPKKNTEMQVVVSTEDVDDTQVGTRDECSSQEVEPSQEAILLAPPGRLKSWDSWTDSEKIHVLFEHHKYRGPGDD